MPQGGGLGRSANLVYTLHGSSGSYMAICTVPGGLQSAAVTIQ